MATQAFLGQGTQYQRETAPASGLFETIAEVRSISGPTFEADEVDVTNMDSPSGFREFIQGLKDGGNITFGLNFLPHTAGHQQLLDDLKTGIKRNYRVRWPQLPTVHRMNHEGFVKSVPLEIPVDDAVTAQVTIRVSGEPVIESE